MQVEILVSKASLEIGLVALDLLDVLLINFDPMQLKLLELEFALSL